MPGSKPNALKAYETAEKRAVRSTLLAGKHVLSPSEIARIRAQIAKNVEDYLPIVDEVIRGTRDFSPTQARVFTALLNKVVPDLSANIHKHEGLGEKPLSEMSMAELEQIAAGVSQARSEMIDQDDVIEGEVLSSRNLTTAED